MLISTWGLWKTLEYGGTDSVNQTFPPIRLSCPIIVCPPKIVAPE